MKEGLASGVPRQRSSGSPWSRRHLLVGVFGCANESYAEVGGLRRSQQSHERLDTAGVYCAQNDIVSGTVLGERDLDGTCSLASALPPGLESEDQDFLRHGLSPFRLAEPSSGHGRQARTPVDKRSQGDAGLSHHGVCGAQCLALDQTVILHSHRLGCKCSSRNPPTQWGVRWHGPDPTCWGTVIKTASCSGAAAGRARHPPRQRDQQRPRHPTRELGSPV